MNDIVIVEANESRSDDYEYVEMTREEFINLRYTNEDERAKAKRECFQINLHKLLSKETLASCYRLIDQVKTDSRLMGLKAIVFLMLKPKGDRNKLHGIDSLEEYRALLDYARDKGVGVGMDSCSAPMALKSLPLAFADSVEPCESGLFSIYVNVDGEVFPCSFTEGTPGWETGIDVPSARDFLSGVWHHPRLEAWRSNLIKSADGCSCDKKSGCRACPIYDITLCKPDPMLGRMLTLVQIAGAMV